MVKLNRWFNLPNGFNLHDGFNLLDGFNLPKATTQMKMIIILALVVVDLNLRGWQMAYHRSTEIALRVSTDTDTDTPWKYTNIFSD